MSSCIFSGIFSDGVATTHTIGTGNYIINEMLLTPIDLNSPAGGACFCTLFMQSTTLGVFFQHLMLANPGAAALIVNTYPLYMAFASGLPIPRGDTLQFGTSGYTNCNGVRYSVNIYGQNMG